MYDHQTKDFIRKIFDELDCSLIRDRSKIKIAAFLFKQYTNGFDLERYRAVLKNLDGLRLVKSKNQHKLLISQNLFLKITGIILKILTLVVNLILLGNRNCSKTGVQHFGPGVNAFPGCDVERFFAGFNLLKKKTSWLQVPCKINWINQGRVEVFAESFYLLLRALGRRDRFWFTVSQFPNLVKMSVVYLSQLEWFKRFGYELKSVSINHNFGSFHIPYIIAANDSNVMVHLFTHGVFFENNLELFPALENRWSVFSERERQICNEVEPDLEVDIHALGAESMHMKWINPNRNGLSAKIEFDVCILCGAGELWYIQLTFQPIQQYLRSINKILVRPHPREGSLGPCTKYITSAIFSPFEVSSAENLMVDVCRCRYVISHSMDSISISLSLGRPVIFMANIDVNCKMLDGIYGLIILRPGESVFEKNALLNQFIFNPSGIQSVENLDKIKLAFG